MQGKEEQAVELRQALDEKRAAFNMLEERLEEVLLIFFYCNVTISLCVSSK